MIISVLKSKSLIHKSNCTAFAPENKCKQHQTLCFLPAERTHTWQAAENGPRSGRSATDSLERIQMTHYAQNETLFLLCKYASCKQRQIRKEFGGASSLTDANTFLKHLSWHEFGRMTMCMLFETNRNRSSVRSSTLFFWAFSQLNNISTK